MLAHQQQQAVVRSIHEKLFFAPILDTLAGAGSLSAAAAEERLSAFGFHDVEQTRSALRELTAGLTRRSRVMQQLLPVLLEWLSDAPDPDLGLLQLRRLTEGYTRSSTVARRFRETPVAAQRACRILGSSRVLGLALHRQPEFLDVLADDDELIAEPTRAPSSSMSRSTRSTGGRTTRPGATGSAGSSGASSCASARATCSRSVTSRASGHELSNLADASVEAALQSLEPQIPFAVIGMGRLGGRELSYASDIDVLFVFDDAGSTSFDRAEHVATRLMSAIGETTAEGQTFRIDARLRPEGKQGLLARSLAGYDAYWRQRAEVWEFQALTAARVVAGDAELGRAFLECAQQYVYREPVLRRVAPRDPPDEGAHRARAHPARRGRALPPQARSRVAVGRRVHRAARATRTRCGTPDACEIPRRVVRSPRSSRSVRSPTKTRPDSPRHTSSASGHGTTATC